MLCCLWVVGIAQDCQDCQIARLPDCQIAGLPDCQIARLLDCQIARDCQDCIASPRPDCWIAGLLAGLAWAGLLDCNGAIARLAALAYSKNKQRFIIRVLASWPGWPAGNTNNYNNKIDYCTIILL